MKTRQEYIKQYMDSNPKFTYTRSVQQAVDWHDAGHRVYCVRIFTYPSHAVSATACDWDPSSESADLMFIDNRKFKGASK